MVCPCQLARAWRVKRSMRYLPFTDLSLRRFYNAFERFRTKGTNLSPLYILKNQLVSYIYLLYCSLCYCVIWGICIPLWIAYCDCIHINQSWLALISLM